MADTTYTHVHVHSLTKKGETISGSQTVTTQGELGRRPQVANAQTDYFVELPINASKLKSLYWLSDQDVTITPYADAVAGDPIELAAGVPLAWYEDCGMDCPIVDDTTHVEIANASGTSAAIVLEHLMDLTQDA